MRGTEGNHSEGLASVSVTGAARWAEGEDSAEGGEAASPPLAPSLSSAASALLEVSMVTFSDSNGVGLPEGIHMSG
jgi:hypothetical protein